MRSGSRDYRHRPSKYSRTYAARGPAMAALRDIPPSAPKGLVLKQATEEGVDGRFIDQLRINAAIGQRIHAHRESSEARAVVTGSRVTSPITPCRLALLWHFRFGRRAEWAPTVRASGGWWSCEEVEDGLPNGRHARLRWRSRDSFFSVPRPGGGGTGGMRRQSSSSSCVGVVPSMTGLRSGRGQVPL